MNQIHLGNAVGMGLAVLSAQLPPGQIGRSWEFHVAMVGVNAWFFPPCFVNQGSFGATGRSARAAGAARRCWPWWSLSGWLHPRGPLRSTTATPW